MSDLPVEQRMTAAVARMRDTLLAMPKFRPTVPELAEQFDEMNAEILDTLIEVSQAAAIDERALIFAKDRSDARNARLLAEQKMRGDYDVAMASLSGQVLVPFLSMSGAN